MKKIFYLILRRAAMTLLVTLLTTVTAWAQTPPEGLDYNPAGYYEIKNSGDLMTLLGFSETVVGNVSIKYFTFKLTADIDMTGIAFRPISNGLSHKDFYFCGKFDGQNHVIKNLTIASSCNFVGLFAAIGQGGEVKNVRLDNVNISITMEHNDCSVGGIAGRNYGTISNCHVAGTISNYDNIYSLGSIVGENIGTGVVSNCSAAAGNLPLVGELYSFQTPGTTTGCTSYYKLTADDDVNLTATSPIVTIGSTPCYVKGTQVQARFSYTGTHEQGKGYTLTDGTNSYAENTNYTLTMNGDYHISSVVTVLNYAINQTATTNGSLSLSQTTGHYGDQVTLTLAPDALYEVATVSVKDASQHDVPLSGSGNTRTFTMPASNVTVSATFQKKTFAIYMTTYGCTASCTPSSPHAGDVVTISVTPSSGMTFKSIQIRDEKWNFLTVNADKTFTMPSTNAYVTVTCSSTGTLQGSGSASDPYLINDYNDLQILSSWSKNHTTSHFALTQDITVPSGAPAFTPIGNIYGQFGGHIDGRGHTISGLTITDGIDGHCSGFVGINQGTIENLTIVYASLAPTGCNSVGGIAGVVSKDHIIRNCHVAGNITLNDNGITEVGGIAGDNSGTICDCTNRANISYTTEINYLRFFGGIAGSASGIIYHCANSGNLTFKQTGSDRTWPNIGGVAGSAYAPLMGNTNSGSISVTVINAEVEKGGIVGKYNSTLSHNYYFGNCNLPGTNNGDVTANQGAVPGYAISCGDRVALADIADNIPHPAYGASGEDILLNITPPENYIIDVVKYNDGSDHVISPVNNAYSFTMPAKSVAVSATFALDIATFFGEGNDGTEANPYTITTIDGWNFFCDCLQDNTTWNRFIGKFVKLGANIGTATNPVTRSAGAAYHDFCGTFDGDNKTLTVSINSTGDYAAPFNHVDDGCTIKRLHVAGTVVANDGHKYAGGLVGGSWSTVKIEDCQVSTIIDSKTDGDGTHGGIVGIQQNGALTIEGCVFDGQLLGSKTYSCGGIVGYRTKGSTDIYNTLFIPTTVTLNTTNTSDASQTFVRNASASCHEGCYFIKPLGGTANQGKRARSVLAGDGVTIEAINPVGAVTNTYNVSGITAYAKGLKYDGNFYYGNGDEVSLTLNHSDREGYTFASYSASAGILSGTKLTMPDENVTISTLWTFVSENSVTFAPAGYATYYNGLFDTTLPAGVSALIVTDKGTAEGSLVYETIADGAGSTNTVPAATAVLLSSEQHAEEAVNLVLSETKIDNRTFDTNLLHGSDTQTTTTGDGKHYKLTYGNSGTQYEDVFGWYFGAENGAAFSSPAHKAWLVVPATTGSAAPFLMLPGQNTTGIMNVNVSDNDNLRWYSLDGQQLQGKPTQQGVYIHNGKKIIIK